MFVLEACRGCLTTEGTLLPIDQNTARSLTVITGIQVQTNDGYPTCICVECKAHFKRALAFRRRFRRAQFVLKEIMLVDKEVTLEALKCVDSDKVNLKSTLKYQDVNTIDITPDNYTDIYTHKEDNRSVRIIENAARQKEIAKALEEIKHDETPIEDYDCNDTSDYTNDINDYTNDINDYTNDIDVDIKDIDPDDIFKGLKQPSDSELDSPGEEEEEKNIDVGEKNITQKDNREQEGDEKSWEEEYVSFRRKKIPEKFSIINVMSAEHKLEVQKCENDHEDMYILVVILEAQVLTMSKITYLSEAEQKERYLKRLNSDKFRKALLRCAICIETFKTTDQIKEHVKFHNRKRAYLHRCSICKNSYKTEELLKRHCMTKHWYRFDCTVCAKEHITLKELKDCCKGKALVAINKAKDPPLTFIQKTALTADEMERYTSGARKFTTFKCDKCDSGYRSQDKLRMHQNYHQNKNEQRYGWCCDICQLYIMKRCKKNNHFEEKHFYKYTCENCKHVMYDFNEAARHHKMCKVKTTGGFCQYCDKIIYENHKKHMQDEHIAHCNICGETVFGLDGLYRHQLHYHRYISFATVPELNDPQLFCAHCNIYFCNESAHFKHICNHHVLDCKQYRNGCLHCHKLFENEEELKSHSCFKNKTFAQFKFIECVHCKKPMSTRQSYIDHCREFHPDLSYQTHVEKVCEICHICGKAFSKTSINWHLKSHKDDRTNFKCKFCDYRSSKTNILHHIMATHTLKPYICTKCSKRFGLKWECREHILKVHSPVLPYKCEVCLRQFAHLDYLNDHCIKVHNINLKKVDKSVYTDYTRMMGLVYVYPHMKIDGSLIPREILAETKTYMCDYLEEQKKEIDVYECFHIDRNIDPDVPTKLVHLTEKQKQQKNRKKARKMESIIRQLIKNNDSENLAVYLKKHDCYDIFYNMDLQNDNESSELNEATSSKRKKENDSEENKAVNIKNTSKRKKGRPPKSTKAPITEPLYTKQTIELERNMAEYNPKEDSQENSDLQEENSYLQEENSYLQEDNSKDKRELSDIIEVKKERTAIFHMPTLSPVNEIDINETQVGNRSEDTEFGQTSCQANNAEATKVEQPMEVEETEMEDVTGELIEIEGQNYVLIDGNMYKVEKTEAGYIIAQ